VFTFIEAPAFERVCSVYLDDEEYAELQQFMMRSPEAGKIVRGSGGVRKLRWSREGGGKRGGLRVIYFVRYDPTSSGCLPFTPRLARATRPRTFSSN
jgi:hypothetical protein